MHLTLLTTLKRENSTFQPNVSSAGFVLDLENIKLRQPCSLHTPAFVVRVPSTVSYADLERYNYALLFNAEGFNAAPMQYLWIDNVTYNPDGMWTVETHIDVLAQYKTEIMQSALYVLRSATNYSNLLSDSAVPTIADVEATSVNIGTGIFQYNYNDGTYIIGVMNDDTEGVGIPHYYAMTHAQWSNFCNQMLSTVNWAGISAAEISSELQKALINPMQYITTAFWLPCPVSTGATINSIPVGFWEIPNSPAARITGAFTTREFTVTLPSHPQSNTLAYTNYSPYSQYKMVFEPFGTITLPAWLAGGETVRGFVYVDPTSGDAVMRLSTAESVIGTYHAKAGLEMPIGQAVFDIDSFSKSSAIQAGVAGAVDVIGENLFSVGAPERVFNGVLSNLAASMTSVQSSGTRGSIAAYIDVPRIEAVFKKLSATNYTTLMGRPCCKLLTLGGLSGFVMCATGDVECGASPSEKGMISRFLTTGFFME